MVGDHSLQRLVRPLLEGGQGLLHLKTLRRQTKDVCLRLLHLALQSFDLGVWLIESHTQLSRLKTYPAFSLPNERPQQRRGSGSMTDGPRNGCPVLQQVLIVDSPLQGVPELLLDRM